MLYPSIDLAHDLQQVITGTLEILELLAEEPESFLHRLELFEGKRIDLAQQGQITFSRLQPLQLFLAHIGIRLGGRRVDRNLITRSGWTRRYQLIRSILIEQRFGVEAELLHRALAHLLDP